MQKLDSNKCPYLSCYLVIITKFRSWCPPTDFRCLLIPVTIGEFRITFYSIYSVDCSHSVVYIYSKDISSCLIVRVLHILFPLYLLPEAKIRVKLPDAKMLSARSKFSKGYPDRQTKKTGRHNGRNVVV